MMGLPKQEIDEVADTIRFVHDCGGWVKVAQYSPIPGTVEFRKAAELNPAIADEPLLHNNSVFSVCGGPERFTVLKEIKDLANALNARLVGSA